MVNCDNLVQTGSRMSTEFILEGDGLIFKTENVEILVSPLLYHSISYHSIITFVDSGRSMHEKSLSMTPVNVTVHKFDHTASSHKTSH